MKTVTIGGSTVTLTESTYARLFGEDKQEQMKQALAERDFATYNRLKAEVAKA